MRPRVSKHVEMVSWARCRALDAQPALLSWVLENLIRNAVDAMDGEGVLTVRAHWREDAFTIEVEDNGKGMTKAARKVSIPASPPKSVVGIGFVSGQAHCGRGSRRPNPRRVLRTGQRHVFPDGVPGVNVRQRTMRMRPTFCSL